VRPVIRDARILRKRRKKLRAVTVALRRLEFGFVIRSANGLTTCALRSGGAGGGRALTSLYFGKVGAREIQVLGRQAG